MLQPVIPRSANLLEIQSSDPKTRVCTPKHQQRILSVFLPSLIGTQEFRAKMILQLKLMLRSSANISLFGLNYFFFLQLGEISRISRFQKLILAKDVFLAANFSKNSTVSKNHFVKIRLLKKLISAKISTFKNIFQLKTRQLYQNSEFCNYSTN